MGIREKYMESTLLTGKATQIVCFAYFSRIPILTPYIFISHLLQIFLDTPNRIIFVFCCVVFIFAFPAYQGYRKTNAWKLEQGLRSRASMWLSHLPKSSMLACFLYGLQKVITFTFLSVGRCRGLQDWQFWGTLDNSSVGRCRGLQDWQLWATLDNSSVGRCRGLQASLAGRAGRPHRSGAQRRKKYGLKTCQYVH